MHDVVNVLDHFIKDALGKQVRDDDEAELILADVLQSRVRADGLCFLFTANHRADLVAMLESLAKSCETHETGGSSEKDEFTCHIEGCSC